MNIKLALPILKFWRRRDSKSAGSLLLQIYASQGLKELGEVGNYLVRYKEPPRSEFEITFSKLVALMWKHDSESLCKALLQLTPFLSESLRKHIGKHCQLLYEDSLYTLTNVSQQVRETRIAQHCCSCWQSVDARLLGPGGWVYCAACHKNIWGDE